MGASQQIAVVIAARDEAAALGSALRSISAAQPPPDPVIVVADHCCDDTAAVARGLGALVMERDTGEAGKGPALRWLFEHAVPGLTSQTVVVVLDADSTVQRDFFAHVQRCFEAGARVTQTYVQPIAGESLAAQLAAYSETLLQKIDYAYRACLGWSVPLRGTGMAFRTDLVRAVLPEVRTRTEDIELTLLLANRGEKIHWLSEAVVFDPKPDDAAGVARQRARWLQGQAQVWRWHWEYILRLLFRGSGDRWLLATVLLRPKTAFVALRLLLFAAAVVLPAPTWLRAALALFVVLDLAYYVGGLWLVPRAERRRYARALLQAPLYPWIWLRSLIMAVRRRGLWLRARP